VISIPVAVVVAQWVVLFGLSALVVVMYRQLAHLLELGGAAGSAGGLDVGARAPSFTYRRPGEPDRYYFEVGQTPAFLLFTDPRCGACDTALRAVETVTRRSRSTGTRVVVVTDADDVAVAANEGLSNTALDVAVVDNAVVERDYRVTATPLLIGVDADGVVRAKASGPDEAGVRRFLREFRRAPDQDHQHHDHGHDGVEHEEEVKAE
jgi:hypothetical protein